MVQRCLSRRWPRHPGLPKRSRPRWAGPCLRLHLRRDVRLSGGVPVDSRCGLHVLHTKRDLMPLTPAERARADAGLAALMAPPGGDAKRFVEAATRDVPWQRAFVYDKSPRKALFGERRGGKTTVIGISMVARRLAMPNSKGIYVGLTQDSARRVFVDEVLDRLKRKYGLPAEIIGGDEMRFSNGSLIYIVGLDATKKQKERVRGIKAADIAI